MIDCVQSVSTAKVVHLQLISKKKNKEKLKRMISPQFCLFLEHTESPFYINKVEKKK